MKKLLIAAAALVAIIIVIAILLTAGKTQKPIIPTTAWPAPLTLNASAPYGEDTLITTNGRSLITYNYLTGTTKYVSPKDDTSSLNGADSLSLSGDKRFVMFHTNFIPDGSTLYAQLEAKQLDTSAPYWWVYNVSSQTFSNLPVSVLLAKFSDNKVTALNYTANGQSVITYDPATLQATTSLPISGAANFIATNSGIIFQDTNNTIFKTENGQVNTTLATQATLIGANQEQQSLYIETNSPDADRQTIIKIDLANNKQETVVKDLNSQAVWSDDTILYTYQSADTKGKSFAGIYDTRAANVTKTWDLTGLENSDNQNSLKPVALYGSSAAAISTNEESLDLVGDGLKQLKPFSTYQQTVPVGNTEVTIIYIPEQRSFAATVPSATPEQISQVYDALRSSGYDPDFYPIIISSGDSD